MVMTHFCVCSFFHVAVINDVRHSLGHGRPDGGAGAETGCRLTSTYKRPASTGAPTRIFIRAATSSVRTTAPSSWPRATTGDRRFLFLHAQGQGAEGNVHRGRQRLDRANHAARHADVAEHRSRRDADSRTAGRRHRGLACRAGKLRSRHRSHGPTQWRGCQDRPQFQCGHPLRRRRFGEAHSRFRGRRAADRHVRFAFG